ncbi:hypothetical protein J6500_04965 [Bradyrhizobium sp. WSM 1704]|uniref:hypothetical protein n=1 Tax=Bradyrhizobium semiaridum TaxID=2821404 RepID=UPI001CE361D0|nr:hypothetical protein [Bradyrhizobium semiaridum]MCA6121258.1 hypothetical protein [Bradyrhizobium semiaridum]
MTDQLLMRASLAIEEARRLREQRRMFVAQQEERVTELRRAIYDSSSLLMEVKACRDDSD